LERANGSKMISAVARGELVAWLAVITEEIGIDVSQYIDTLTEQGLSKAVLYEVPDDEWSTIESIPLGHRIVLRIAASEIFLKAERTNLTDQIARLGASRDSLAGQSARDRAELDRITGDVSQREMDINQGRTSMMQAQQAMQQKEAGLTTVTASVDGAKAEIAQLLADISRAQAEKSAALKQKEDAIMRAVAIGTGQGATPQAAAPAESPAGNGYGQPHVQPYPGYTPAQPAQSTPTAQPPIQTYRSPAPPPQQPPPAAYQPPAPTAAAPQPMAPAPPRVPVSQQPWYFDTISREECESKLAGGLDGDFMIRKSSRGQNSYSLSVRASGGAVKHFKIEKQPTGRWRLAQKNSDGREFGSIAELVEHYMAYGASGIRLARAVPKPGPAVATAAPPAGGSFLPPSGQRMCWDSGCTGMPIAADDRFCGGCGKPTEQILKWAP